MRNKMIGTICLVLGIVIIVSTGTSFAYFGVSIDGNGNNITGSTMNFDVELTLNETYKATKLIPLEDTLISYGVNNKCVDKLGYQVCSLYKITLTNTGDAQILNGYITAEEGTTYITKNLKAQLFNSNLTAPVSSILTLTDEEETNLEERRYFKIDDTDLFTAEITNSNTYYLAIWLTETHDYQDDDYAKDFVGKIAFESLAGDVITAEFNT